YPFCSCFRRRTSEARASGGADRWKAAGRPGMGSKSVLAKLPALRFRGKVMLSFAVVLALSAASMGMAYLGFEAVSGGVATYRNSVTEADLARNIDRELISYQALARYYV